MRTTIDLPDPIYAKGEQVAKAKGFTLEQLIVRAIEREVAQASLETPYRGEISLPLIHSRRPGTLDLSSFDFDDLLA
ncbi:MAG: hypothetical protein AAB225_03500 [Acidobacteriota bacterium]